ncbi:MAG TPA: DUF3887 domain-containing protein [Candidatus Blautia avicola]|uniref:DUF3887 domain-containing protein n=1 Tax=Candidatus Blautia avicola TaxID=2838483 RepID=A0A9D2QS49_9FIRM|nr:DUF3887 domain-containing protein [Candidatus Blautia avicola]
MKKGKWRKKILAGFLGILMLAGVSGCQEALSEEFEEDQVIAEAKEMVERINAGELEGVWEDTFNVVMQNGTDPEELQENIDYYLKDKGEFQDFDKIQVRGITDRDTGTPYATVMVLAAYEDGKVMFTISFDTDMKCAGFYVK